MRALWWVVLLAACSGKPEGPKTPEDLAKAAFAALQTSDADAFVQLGATESDIEDMWDQMAAHVREAEREIKQRRKQDGGERGAAERLHKKMRASFREALTAAGGAFPIAQAEWVEIYRRRDQEAWGVRRKDFYFRVKQGGKLWQFKLNNCVLLSGRWVLTGGVDFRGEKMD